MPNRVLPVAVVGCGKMGRLHARVYAQMPQCKLVGVYDAHHDTAKAVAAEYGTKAFGNLADLLCHVAAVTIAVPTRHHVALAEPFLKRGVACLIEKPLAGTAAECRRIVEASKASGSLVQVGHIERFNPAIRAIERLNIQPRYIEVHRVSPLTFRSIDVGVVLDMMIHDIDIVLKLADSKPKKVEAVGVSVIGPADPSAEFAGPEDVCNARVEFENGVVANMTASRLAFKTDRRMRLFSSDAYVAIDYAKKQALVARKAGNVDSIRSVVAGIRSGEVTDLSQIDFTELVDFEQLAIDDVEPIRAELESFVAAVIDKTPSPVSAEQGLAAVELAERIVAAVGGATV